MFFLPLAILLTLNECSFPSLKEGSLLWCTDMNPSRGKRRNASRVLRISRVFCSLFCPSPKSETNAQSTFCKSTDKSMQFEINVPDNIYIVFLLKCIYS